MKKLLFLFLMLILACTKQEKADLLVINGNIYTVNDSFAKAEAFAVKEGKIIAVGSTQEIKNNYRSSQTINAEGKAIYPGFIDAHCHFFGLGLAEQNVRLEGTKSFDEVLDRIVAFQKDKNLDYITGRGWDQNDWEVKEFPTKDKLDSLFPNTPVAITRVDGHALLANQAAIDLAGVTTQTPFSGGYILQKDGKLTGIFIDNPMRLIRAKIPVQGKETFINAWFPKVTIAKLAIPL
ncbi:MAG: amidohydrolase family protein [Flavobacteriaceae bacterium]|nr:amidohydrolase family protein [Flavobacteriaceae bacterium]